MKTKAIAHKHQALFVLLLSLLLAVWLMQPATGQGTVDAVDDFYTLYNDVSQGVPAGSGVLVNDSPGVTILTSDSQTSAGNLVTVGADGSLVLDPPPGGYIGLATFTYTVTDGAGAEDTATVHITYEMPPPPPASAGDDYFTLSSVGDQFIEAPGLFANDISADLLLSHDSVTTAGNAVVVNADGSVQLASANGYGGEAYFVYAIADSLGGSSSATVTLNYVQPDADAIDDYYTLTNNTDYYFDAPGLLANDSVGTYVVDSNISSLFDGSGYINGDGSWHVPFAGDFVGVVSFYYTIDNGSGSQDSATVYLTYEAQPGSLVTAPDFFTTTENTPLSNANVLANDVGTGLFIIPPSPSSPELNVTIDGWIVYTPPVGYIGSFTFSYFVEDALGNQAEELVTITVDPLPAGCGYAIPQSECDGLVNLYNSTNGPGWANNGGWAVDFAAPCNWYGVYCSGGHVVSIDLYQNQLSGTIPALPFPFLEYLNLSYNQLTGTIPPLPATLQTLQLQSNQLTGNIPELPGSLVYLNLSTNQLTGGIPSLPPSLETLYASENLLTGNVPPFPSSLQDVQLGNNLLTGNIPALPASLRILSLASNQLTGGIPILPATLETLILVNNQLTGGIPALPANLQVLGLGNNQLTGNIPALPASLLDLSLRDNQLTGSIPVLPSGLYFLWLHNNQLSGEIPASLTTTAIVAGDNLRLCGGSNDLFSTDPQVNSFIDTLKPGWTASGNRCIPLAITNTPTPTATPTLTATPTNTTVPIGCASQTQIPENECAALVNLYNSTNGPNWINRFGWTVTNSPCSWHGITCVNGHVTQIFLASNNLIGTLPELPQFVEVVNLSFNQLTGSIPALPATIEALGLAGNQLSGTIPALPSELVELILWENQLTNSIPELPSSLQRLELFDNQLTGSIPPLPNSLNSLLLFDNLLTGSIPSFPDGVHWVDLRRNQLSGAIPALPALLGSLYLSSNHITGVIPALPAAMISLDVSGNQLTGSIPPLPPTLIRLNVGNNLLSGEIPTSITSTGIPTFVNDNYLVLCGGANNLYSTNGAVNTFIAVRIPTWSPNSGCFANILPTAHAGADQTVTDTDNNGSELVTLNGSMSGDVDGSIDNYSWAVNGGEFATGVSPTVNLPVGTHVIALTVTDNRGGTATDMVTIEVVAIPTDTPTVTPTETPTLTPSYTPSPVDTPTEVPTATPTSTDLPSTSVAYDDVFVILGGSVHRFGDRTLFFVPQAVALNDYLVNPERWWIELVSDPSQGSLVLYDNGAFVFLLNDIPMDFVGNVTFSYRIVDEFDYPSNVATVTLYIDRTQGTPTATPTHTPQAPLATDDVYELRGVRQLEIGDLFSSEPQGVLENDGNAQGFNLAASLMAQPEVGFVNLYPNGAFTFDGSDLPEFFSGEVTFTYRAVIANTYWSEPATVTLRVVHSLARDDEYTLLGAGSFEIGDPSAIGIPQGVTLNDDVVNLDRFYVRRVTQATQGSVFLSENGAFIFSPTGMPADFVGAVTFTYWILDVNGYSNIATVTLNLDRTQGTPTVTPSPTVSPTYTPGPSIAVDDQYLITEGEVFQVGTRLPFFIPQGVTLNDTISTPSRWSVIQLSDTAMGNVLLEDNGAFTLYLTGIPLSFVGNLSFTYLILDDNDVESNIATVTLHVDRRASIPSDTPTSTLTPTWTPSPSLTPSATSTPSPTATPTPTLTPTWTPSPSLTPSSTPTPAPTATPTPTTVSNAPPIVNVFLPSTTTIGSVLALNAGSFRDPDGHAVTLSVSHGSITPSRSSGGFWSYPWAWVWVVPSSVPRGSVTTVTITARDSLGAVTSVTFTVRKN